MPTIRQVAEHANVSIATVSRVINNSSSVTQEIRTKVLEAVNRCGYVPNVSRRSTSFLGLIYTGPFALGSTYDMSLVEGMGQAMTGVELDLVILDPTRDRGSDETYTQYFLRKGIRGVILRSTVEGRKVCKQIAEENFPAIVVGDHFDHPTLNFVYADSFTTSKQAIEHLISLGHRKIAFAANEFDDGDHVDRYRAYVEVLDRNGIPLENSLVFRIPAHRPDGAQLLRSLMSVPNPPTAVYITDPSVAVGLLNEAHSMRLNIPRELSVVGFDDRDMRDFVYPKMTSVCQDANKLGSVAFLQLAKMVDNGMSQRPDDRIETSWFEINGTTGRIPEEQVRVLPDGTRIRLDSA
ncbi:LacI family DNA-binding transcriptional regulator [Bythopirellula goksoeyrii]|uniref:Catabolite control protein A n=1 Tax=Bythopirellula goksoeyrii TaxID=1400387 RepID=A0A5B9QFS9_9BACT|nr:LacI family DNA-binding transcriptional regulator [Bythopirellula goksoeyrii]QEG36422.1 Catabolite control protein A [Bythopirellula goksoeyrii]